MKITIVTYFQFLRITSNFNLLHDNLFWGLKICFNVQYIYFLVKHKQKIIFPQCLDFSPVENTVKNV